MKQGRKKAASPNMVGFPEDVITDILVRLPSKSLARSRCVSNYWNTLITSPSFIKAHLLRSSQYHNHLLYQDSKFSEQFMSRVLSGEDQFAGINTYDDFMVSKLRKRDSGWSEFTNLDPPPAVTDGFKNFKLVDSFGGIVCLLGVNEPLSTSGMWLWNPAINDCFALPETLFPIASYTAYCVGFGFNPHLDDFKVVSVTITDHTKYHTPDQHHSSRVEIYSRRANSWNALVDCFPNRWQSSIGKMGDQVILEEYICWRPYRRRRSGKDKVAILSFNVVTEEFQEMALADSIPTCESDCITVLDGCLALMAYYSVSGFEVWTMREFGNVESWTKLYNIELMPGQPTRAMFRPLGVGSTDEAIFSASYYLDINIPSPTYLLSYDTQMKAIVDNSAVTLDSSAIGRLVRYVETLNPISRISSLQEEEEGAGEAGGEGEGEEEAGEGEEKAGEGEEKAEAEEEGEEEEKEV